MKTLTTNAFLHRRDFVKGMGIAGAALMLGTFGGCEQLAQEIANRPTRRRIQPGSAAVQADLTTYSNAVSLMKALPSADKRNWAYQAWIHGTVQGGFNLCPHGTEYFFPWHRAYLFFFEKICQKLTNDTNFGLPYWNWNQNPDINPAFLNSSSPLYLQRANVSVSGNPAVSDPTLTTIFGENNFFTFWPQIEGTPHNTVHSVIGDTMGTGGSALDPVFWTHHCMVDYCWYKWNIDLGNNNPNDPTWMNTSWNYFIDNSGATAAPMSVAETLLMPLLSYQYEESPIGAVTKSLVVKTKETFQQVQQRIKTGAAVKLDIQQRVTIADRAVVSIAKPLSFAPQNLAVSGFAAIINNDASRDHVFLSIKYAELPEESDFYVRVFINQPNANSDTPVTDPHYCGSFAFFGTKGDMRNMHSTMPMQPTFLVSITQTLVRLKAEKQLADNTAISVQLVAIPFMGKLEKEDTQLKLEEISVIVTPVTIN